MRKYRLNGNYGTFVIERVVEAENRDEAYKQTGIMMDLEEVGWTFIKSPDGEEWSIKEVEDPPELVCRHCHVDLFVDDQGVLRHAIHEGESCGEASPDTYAEPVLPDEEPDEEEI